MRRLLPRTGLVLGLLAFAAISSASAGETAPHWQLTPRVEHSDVVVNGNAGQWDAWSIAMARATDSATGVEAMAGRQDRNGISDDELHVSAHGRAGAWDATASVQLSPEAHFLPEWGYELQADRAVGARVRAGAGYRRMQFRASSVDLWSTQATVYRGDDELGVEYRIGRNAVLDHDIRVVQVRGSMLRGRSRFSAYLAHGDYLFDALGVAGGDGRGWSATVAFARSVTPSTTVRLEAGAGGEADTFRQRTIAVSVQFSP